MKAAEIRSKFLKYFEKQGHTILESSSLVPHNDPSLLFTNAGMNQFKDVFLGKDPRPYTRATTSQKCVRAGGKHNDLENVGFTARHHTFFEMLGNFSFGDYFKKDAIRFAWEFVTTELGFSKEFLTVSVFEKDDEAADIWHKQEGVPRDRIYKFGEKDNFWSMGDTGPCGPCSEIFYDRGEKYGCGKPTCKMGCDCDRYMEFWNLVFMQFNRDASGTLTPLPKPSVDTGAGLERITLILQDVQTNYDTDLFQTIIQRTSDLAQKKYILGSEDSFSFRVIADHSRATAFLIGDGVMPSNEGRGYVLRRIMRRAIRHGKKLGFTEPFLSKTVRFVIDQMQEVYPDLVEKQAFIERAVLAEEEQFFRTLERGLVLLDEETEKLISGSKGSTGILSGDVAFKLYDTYGFPLDLTRVICTERGLGVDESGFERAMDRQKNESRKHWKGSGEEALNAVYLKLSADLKAKNTLPRFVGYEQATADGRCVALLTEANQELKSVESITAPPLAQTADSGDAQTFEAIFAVTPFYGESGGQVGDSGRVSGHGFEGQVIDVQRPVPDLIVAKIKPLKGSISLGQTYLQETDIEIRNLTSRNHTATHLLQWALREVLGQHVKQAGSLVTSDLLRFDFTHFQAMTEAELFKVENLINQKVWADFPVTKREMEKDAAVAAGAIAFFGEKYGDVVRVVQVGGFSTELCGGTHISHSSEIHLFKISSESGIAAGVRRIIATTSRGAFDYLRVKDQEIKAIRDWLKASSSDEIMGKLEKLFTSERELRKQLEQLLARSQAGEVDEWLQKAHLIRSTHVVSAQIEISSSDESGIKKLRDLADRFKQKAPDGIFILGVHEPGGEKASLLVAVGPQAPKTVSAGDLIKEMAPLIDGRGGGKADLAQAGGTKVSGLKEALEKGLSLAKSKLS